MKLYNAVRLGNAIEEYNKRFEEKMHLDFYEVVSLMLEPDEEIDLIIEEIEKRIELRAAAEKLYIHDKLGTEEFNNIIMGL